MWFRELKKKHLFLSEKFSNLLGCKKSPVSLTQLTLCWQMQLHVWFTTVVEPHFHKFWSRFRLRFGWKLRFIPFVDQNSNFQHLLFPPQEFYLIDRNGFQSITAGKITENYFQHFSYIQKDVLIKWLKMNANDALVSKLSRLEHQIGILK